MKNKYYVVSPNGSSVEPHLYVNSIDCDSDFKIIIEHEAIGLKSNVENLDSNYLKYANKFGFRWEDNSDIGFIQYNHKADLIMRLVKDYSRKLVNEIGLPIYEVKGVNFFNMNYPVVQAYAGLFGDRLFQFKDEDKNLVMSYDASYPQFNLASKSMISYEAMPFAHFSLSDCYRYEQSGECMLLYRGRRFFMPDLHPYLRSIEESFEWYHKIQDKILEACHMANRNYWNIVKVSSEKYFQEYFNQIVRIAKSRDQPVLVEVRCDDVDRYWILDVDYSIVDAFKQVREIACIQIDIGNSNRLGIKYIDRKGVKQNPVIIHAAVPGGIERFIYMLVDNFKLSFPSWLRPIQVRILPVGQDYLESAMQFQSSLQGLNLRIEVDDRAESVSKRIKLAYEDLVPEVIVFGQKEIDNLHELKNRLIELSLKNNGFPFIDFSWPKLVSKQIR